MKSSTVLITLGILVVVTIHIVSLIQDKFPTYSLFYLMGGILIGAGFVSQMTDK